MTRLTLIAALLSATPTIAATVEDPDSPRFGDGLRVLGFREDVSVYRLDEYAAIDREPLFLAQTRDREAVFREGEDACMSKIAVGVFVPCAGADVAREVARAEAVAEPLRGHGVTVWPSAGGLPTGGHRPGGGWDHSGGGGHGPWPPVDPPVVAPPPAPIPLPATSGLMLLALFSLGAAVSGRFARWFTAERGAGPGKNGWV